MRLLLTKAAAVRAYGGVERQLAIALGITAQAVNAWGRYVPERNAYRILELKPELRSEVKYARY